MMNIILVQRFRRFTGYVKGRFSSSVFQIQIGARLNQQLCYLQKTLILLL